MLLRFVMTDILRLFLYVLKIFLQVFSPRYRPPHTWGNERGRVLVPPPYLPFAFGFCAPEGVGKRKEAWRKGG